MTRYSTISIEKLDSLPDPNTENMLLPSLLVGRDNSRRVRHYHTALRQALRILPQAERGPLTLYYLDGLCKSEIARRHSCSRSAIGRCIKRAEGVLRTYIELYMTIYDTVEQELRNEW